MTIDQIECFVTVASTGSLSQAAARLLRSQPNLTYAINQLEADLGYPVLSRTNQGAVLTPEGAVFLKQANKALEAFQRLQNFSLTQDHNQAHALRLGVMPFCGVTQALSVLLRHPMADMGPVVMNQCMRDELISGLADRQYDLGVIYAYPSALRAVQVQLEDGGLEARELARCVPTALVGRGCGWFDDKVTRVSTQWLSKLYRVFFARQGVMSFSSTQFRSLASCAGHILAGDQLDLKMILNSIPSFTLAPCTKELLQSGGTIMEDLRCVSISGHDMVGAYYAVYRKQQPPAGMGAALLEVLQRQLTCRG